MRAFVLTDLQVAIASSIPAALVPLLAHAADVKSLLPYALSLLNAFGPTLLLMVLKWRRARIDNREKLAAKMLADADPKNDNDALNIQVQDAEEAAVLDVAEQVADKIPGAPKL